MRRESSRPRRDWQRHMEEKLGFIFHTLDGATYWDESAYYTFDPGQIAELEEATNALEALCLEAAGEIIRRDWFHRLCIPPSAIEAIVAAWNDAPFAIYGRFDLAYDGATPPRLLEYNADTPTSLYEAAVVQWDWLRAVRPEADQFNSIHERLVAKWSEFPRYSGGAMLHFAHCASVEDLINVTYLRDTAQQAGIATDALMIEDVGWSETEQCMVDAQNRRIAHLFKLYPWEWLLFEGESLDLRMMSAVQWIEPIWKMLWSNKALLAILWELFPGHPNLLPAYLDDPRELREYARKPLLSREGANVELVTRHGTHRAPGDYGGEGFVFQALAPVPNLGGKYPVMGSWVIDGEAGGMGIRESSTPITDNLSRFVPHCVEE